MIKSSIKVFMDDFALFGIDFDKFLDHLIDILKRCVETNLILNSEKCQFMVTEGIILGINKVITTNSTMIKYK